MATRYEYYIIGDDTANPTWTQYWKGQTFTPSVSHTITFVRLKLSRNGNPGQLTVSIRATSGGNPIDADLCSGTYDSSTLPADGWRNAEWVVITLGDGTPLTTGTMYAIIIRIPDGDASNSVLWNTDQTFPTYTRGTKVSSSTAGATWVAPAPGEDLLFEEWGDPLLAGRFKVKGTYQHYVDNNLDERRFEGTLTGNARTAGSIKTKGTKFVYGDNNGDERDIEGTLTSNTVTAGKMKVKGTQFRYGGNDTDERYIEGSLV